MNIRCAITNFDAQYNISENLPGDIERGFKQTHGIFKEEIQYHSGKSIVAPVAVHQQQPLQELEPREREVRRHHRLPPLLPRQTWKYDSFVFIHYRSENFSC